MRADKRLVIELDEDCEPFVRLIDESGEHLVPVRLRGRQENLTPTWRDHEVFGLEWYKIEQFSDNPTSLTHEWALLATHDVERCARCALLAEAKQRDTLLDDYPIEDWETTADRAQAFYHDTLVRWTDEPEPLNPMLDYTLRREHARVCVGTAQLRQWIDLALRYVHSQMQITWKEEDDLCMKRSTLMYLRLFGVFEANESEADSTYVHNETMWRVTPEGDTERLIQTSGPNGLTIQQWVADPAGRELPGWGNARSRSLTLQSERSQTPGQRRAIPREFDMTGIERRRPERIRKYCEEAARLRTQLVAITRDIRGA